MLLNQINTLDIPLTAIKARNQHEVAYYQRRIEELETNSIHVFKYISEIQTYVEKKISNLEVNLYYAQVDLQRAQQEITKWRDLYFQLRDSIAGTSLPSTPIVHTSASHCTCIAAGGYSYNMRPRTSSGNHFMCGPNCFKRFLKVVNIWEGKVLLKKLGWKESKQHWLKNKKMGSWLRKNLCCVCIV